MTPVLPSLRVGRPLGSKGEKNPEQPAEGTIAAPVIAVAVVLTNARLVIILLLFIMLTKDKTYFLAI
jgi:hypothetical protein